MWKMPTTLKITGGVLVVIFLLMAAGFFYWSYLASAAGNTSQASELFWTGLLIAVIIVATTIGIFGFYYYSNKKEAYLMEKGIQGEAKVLEVQQTGMYVNNLPQVKFLLEINIPGEVPYKLEHKEVKSYIGLGNFAVGATLPVYVDPKNPKNVLLGEGLVIPPEVEKNIPPDVKEKINDILRKNR